MSTSRHPCRPLVWWTVVVLCMVDRAMGQIGLVSFGTPMFLHPAPLLSHPPRPAPPPPAARESEIAAVFRGVAYGAPTTTPATLTAPSIATPTTTTRTTTTSRNPPQDVGAKYQVAWGGTSTAPGPKEVVLVSHSPAPALSDQAEAATPRRPATNVSLERAAHQVLDGLDAAWLVHVYGAGVVLVLLAGAAICCLARAAPTPTQRGVQALAGVGAGLRAGRVLGGYSAALGPSPALLLDEVPWPALTLALALLLLLLLPRPTSPRRHHLPLLLPLLAAAPTLLSLAAYISALVLPRHAPPLAALARALTATGGGGVALAGLWALWRGKEGGAGLLLGRSGGRGGAGLALVACLAQLALAALTLYMVAIPLPPPIHSWAWWGRLSLARTLEVVVGMAVIAGAAVAGRRQETALLATLRRCGREGLGGLGGRGADVFPASPDKLATLTLKPPPPWSCPAPSPAPQPLAPYLPDPRPSMLVNEGGFLRFRPLEDPAPPHAHTPARYYCAPAATLGYPRHHSGQRGRTGPAARRHQTLPAPPHRRRQAACCGEYQVAPYCLPAPAPAPVYATPHHGGAGGSWSSLSEVQVDYLTDVSSSTDVLHLPPRAGPAALALTLDLPPAPSSARHLTPACQPDLTPDSAVVLDYYTSEEEHTPHPVQLPPYTYGAGRGGLFSKLVGGGRGGGYSPLHVDDVSSPSLETNAPPSTPLAPVHRQVSLPHSPTHTSPPPPLSVTPL